MRAATPDRPAPPQSPTIAIEGCDADQGGDLLPCECPQFGEFQQQRPGTHGSNARGALQQVVVCPPERTAPQYRLQVVVQRGETCLESGHMGFNVRLDAPAGPREAVLLRWAHGDQLLAAPQEGAQLLRRGVRQRAGRRADHIGKMCQRACI